MHHSKDFATAKRYLGNAILLRCPVCGQKPIFISPWKVRSLRDWFTPLDGCPRCGYPYEREPGYFLMAIWAMSYGVGSVVGLIIYGLLEWFYDLPIWTLIACVVFPVAIFNILFARHAKAIFLAVDHFFDPHERGGGDDGGNKPSEAPPPADSPADHKPVKPSEPTGVLH